MAESLAAAGWDPKSYELSDVPGLASHELFWPGRNYTKRPNVVAVRRGTGGGRSLILSGHIDTVPKGTLPWTRDPFGGAVEGNLLYGRGSNDMKAGVATNLFVAEAVAALKIPLKGDLTVEAVVDEEFGGVNGTLAGRLMGYVADAAVISEPSFLRVCPAQRGGRTVHVTLSATAAGGVLNIGVFPRGVAPQLYAFLGAIQRFGEERRNSVSPHPLYENHADPVPVSVTKIYTGPWGTGEPTSIPSRCMLEVYWQAMPGELLEDIDAQFESTLDALVSAHPDLFPTRPEVVHPIRWLPGSAIERDEPVVQEMAACAQSILGRPVTIAGIEGPCDMYVFHDFGIPAILWGGKGGNTHEADEYVEIDSVLDAAKSLLLFVYKWCGV
jgi:acetylornithine deacetylase